MRKNGVLTFGKFVLWTIVLVVVFGLAGGVYFFTKVKKPLRTSATVQTFEVDPGMTAKQTAKRLEDEGLIHNSFFFELYTYYKNQSSSIRAGTYALSADMAISDILKKLTAGESSSAETRLTVLEGWTAQDIAKVFSDSNIASQQEFIVAASLDYSGRFPYLADKPAGAVLEGFLFPDTYFLGSQESAERAVRRMLENFDAKFTAEMRQKVTARGMSVYDLIILASIIEREVGRNVRKGERLSASEMEKVRLERRMVASVFYNRLAINMALESDATIRYITGSTSSRATFSELGIDSPYNTYKYRGLPPTPISNPSLDSILAAIEPTDTNYFFFLTSPDGTAYFAENFSGHQQNRARYLD